MLKRIILVVVLLWLLLISTLYLSCQKVNRTSPPVRTAEEEIPYFTAVDFDSSRCEKQQDRLILSALIPNLSTVNFETNDQGRLTALDMNGVLLEKKFEVVPAALRCFEKLQELNMPSQGLRQIDFNSPIFDLKDLQVLNLSDNPISEISILGLEELKKLRYLYLYRTSLSAENQQRIREVLPQVNVVF